MSVLLTYDFIGNAFWRCRDFGVVVLFDLKRLSTGRSKHYLGCWDSWL